MTFAASAGLWLGLIALPVIALYILKIKRHRRTVPYLRMWEKLVADQQFSTLFQKLQRIFSLLLQLLIALALVFAFASLALGESVLKEESVVLIVDTSASMAGDADSESAKTRFQVAVDRAREMIENRSGEDEYAVLSAGRQPEVLQGFSRSTLRLREAIDELGLTKSSGDLVAAHRLARDLLQGKKHPRIVLLTDRAGGQAERLAANDSDVRWQRVGDSVDNVGILRFQARKNHAVGTDYLLIVVGNQSDVVKTVQLEVWLEGKLRKVVPVELAPRDTFSETLELSLPEGGFAKVVIKHPDVVVGDETRPGSDGLALDDVAFAAVPTARDYRVLLVTREAAQARPFRAAFSSLGTLIDAENSIAETPAGWTAMDAKAREAFDLVLFADWAPEQLPDAGNYFLLFAFPASGLQASVRGVERQPRIRDAAEGHAMNRFLEPKGMQLARAKPLDLSSGETFLSTPGGHVGVVFRSPRRKVVYLGIDVLSDLFFLQVAFPILIRNALGWMHEEESNLLEPTYAPGDVIRPRFAVADAAVEVGFRREWTRESGKARLAVRDGTFFYRDTSEPGRYWVETESGSHRTTVNLFDLAESDLSLPTEAAEDDGGLDVESSGFLFGKDLWPILLLVALGCWILEWGLFHRRITE